LLETNPFNESTTINYTIPNGNDVTIKVYDMLGKEIKTLINEYKPAGNYNVIWNGLDNNNKPVPSGVYVYSLEVNGWSKSRKMILMK